MMKRGLLLPIAAPSGTGKTTVCRELLKRNPRFQFSVSATTRQPRPRERDGVDYYFLTRAQFERSIAAGQLVEHEEVFGEYYGTLQSVVDDALAEERILLLDIDVKGALSIKRRYTEQTVAIFLLPPDADELLRRLKGRGTDDADSIAIRQARIPDELNIAEQFDYQIVNDKLNDTVEHIMKLIKEHSKE